MPPDSNGSGASPAEPDQPTQAPPRPATKGSSAVTSPPGLRCQRVSPSGPVTWSTGSRLATTTTGLSAPTLWSVSCPALSAIPSPTLSGQRVSGRRGTESEDQTRGQVAHRTAHRALLHEPDDVVAERGERGERPAEAGADERQNRGGDVPQAQQHTEDRAAD